MKKLYFISFIIFSILFANCAKDNNDPEPEPEPEPEAPEGPVKVEKTNPMHVYVHYMVTGESIGKWPTKTQRTLMMMVNAK
jgi:hypothetical protein